MKKGGSENEWAQGMRGALLALDAYGLEEMENAGKEENWACTEWILRKQ